MQYYNQKIKGKSVVILLFILLVSVLCGVLTSTNATAYTDAQKKQAKAWLSSHGYPPTRAGAYQAVSDYRSGKLKLSESEQKLAKSAGVTVDSDKKDSTSKKSAKKAKKKKEKKEKRAIKEPLKSEQPSKSAQISESEQPSKLEQMSGSEKPQESKKPEKAEMSESESGEKSLNWMMWVWIAVGLVAVVWGLLKKKRR